MALSGSALRLTRATGVLLTQSVRSMAEMPLTFAAPSQVFYNRVDVRQIDVPSFRSAPRRGPPAASRNTTRLLNCCPAYLHVGPDKLIYVSLCSLMG